MLGPIRLVYLRHARGMVPAGNRFSRGLGGLGLTRLVRCFRDFAMSIPRVSHPPGGTLSAESTPQVVVRAGKHYVCTACGTLVEIPADVVGMLAVEVNPAPRHKAAQLEAAHLDSSQSKATQQPEKQQPAESLASSPPSAFSHDKQKRVAVTTRAQEKAHDGNAQTASPQPARPPRPKRPVSPHRKCFAGQTIDGLIVPTAHKLDRAVSWVMFHLRVLDRQGREFERLRKILKKRRRQVNRGGTDHWTQSPPGKTNRSKPLPSPPSREQAKRSSASACTGWLKRTQRRHAHADVSMAPAANTVWNPRSMEPPARRPSGAAAQGAPRQLRACRRMHGRSPP